MLSSNPRVRFADETEFGKSRTAECLERVSTAPAAIDIAPYQVSKCCLVGVWQPIADVESLFKEFEPTRLSLDQVSIENFDQVCIENF